MASYSIGKTIEWLDTYNSRVIKITFKTNETEIFINKWIYHL